MTSRRKFIQASGLMGVGLVGGLSACTSPKFSQKFIDRNLIASNSFRKFPKLEISMDRIVKETVGLRPFRKKGFRVEKEMLGNKTIVHNYGHGGSGWSMSWGTGNLAANLVDTTGERKIAVMGSGVVGIATSRLLQKRGYEVTIYTKALPPHVTSSKATGTWSPASRIIEKQHLTPEFEDTWRKAATYSFQTYQNLMGLGDIVTWIDNYKLGGRDEEGDPDDRYAHLRIPELLPEEEVLNQKQHPFSIDKVTKQTTMVFNIPSYLNKHTDDFLQFGGQIKIRQFKSLEDVDSLSENCVVNCTGLGSMELFNDQDMMPVSGQLSFLIPEPDFRYRITAKDGYAIPRKDGIVLGGNGIEGSWDESPSREQTEKVIHALQEVMNGYRV